MNAPDYSDPSGLFLYISEENSLEKTEPATAAGLEYLLGWAFIYVERDPSNPPTSHFT